MLLAEFIKMLQFICCIIQENFISIFTMKLSKTTNIDRWDTKIIIMFSLARFYLQVYRLDVCMSLFEVLFYRRLSLDV